MVTAKQSQTLTPNPELYLLGHSYDEERRLKKQAEELRQESARLFDRIGVQEGSRAIDLGCGPQGVLDLLSERVGATGHVKRSWVRVAAIGSIHSGKPTSAL